jgi:hypothetical protein
MMERQMQGLKTLRTLNLLLLMDNLLEPIVRSLKDSKNYSHSKRTLIIRTDKIFSIMLKHSFKILSMEKHLIQGSSNQKAIQRDKEKSFKDSLKLKMRIYKISKH